MKIKRQQQQQQLQQQRSQQQYSQGSFGSTYQPQPQAPQVPPRRGKQQQQLPAHLTMTPPTAEEATSPMFHRQRVGSFRSRLQKQTPILVSDSDSTFSPEVAAAMARVGSAQSSTEAAPIAFTTSAQVEHARSGGRWSAASDTEVAKPSQLFFRYGSNTASKSSSRDEDVEAASNNQPPTYLSVPYKAIQEDESSK